MIIMNNSRASAWFFWLNKTAVFAGLLMIGVSTTSLAETSRVVPGGPARLTFEDEFNGSALDRAKWSTNYTNVMVNLPGELQAYVPNAFEVGQGRLGILANRQKLGKFEFTSGAMTTFGAFDQTYGYFEIRARVPSGKGLWPALWMLPVDKSWPPEIDIMEFLGRDIRNVWMTYHWNDASGKKQKDGSGAASADWTKDFHVYGLQWRPGLLVWYLDGVEVKRIVGTHVPSAPMFLLANLALGGDWAGPPDRTTIFPARFEIDYVRAYQYDDVPQREPSAYRYLTSGTNKPVAKGGDEVAINVGVDIRDIVGTVRFQLILTEATTQKRVATHDVTVPVNAPGSYRRSWTYQVPSALPKGLYVVSFGLFAGDWKQIDWLNNATTILVE